MNSLFKKIRADNFIKVLISLFITGVFLRFYRFNEFVTFLGDQGRDAIILKRIITFEHFPAIGATSSIGQVFLGPFYYYFIAPWLAIFNFHPIGPAIGVGIFSCLGILMSYYVAERLFNRKTALIYAVLITFSFVLIELSRFSWNPNLLPFASLLYFYFFYFAIKEHNNLKFFLSGAFLSICIQLHYISLALFLPTFLILLYDLYICYRTNTFLEEIKRIGNMIGGFILLSIPLIVFDLRHNFLNSRNFIKLFSGSEAGSTKGISEILYTFNVFNSFVLSIPINSYVTSGVVILMLLACIIYCYKKQLPESFLLFFFLTTLVMTSFYTGMKFSHYFASLYPLYYLLISYFLSKLFYKKALSTFLLVFLVAYIYFQSTHYYFFFNHGNNQISKASAIAKVIKNQVHAEKFQVTGLPDKYSDSTYRYFLEIWGERPLSKDSIVKADALFVICEKECAPIGDPQWDIAFFAPTKIVLKMEKEGVFIYKLTR